MRWTMPSVQVRNAGPPLTPTDVTMTFVSPVSKSNTSPASVWLTVIVTWPFGRAYVPSTTGSIFVPLQTGLNGGLPALAAVAAASAAMQQSTSSLAARAFILPPCLAAN